MIVPVKNHKAILGVLDPSRDIYETTYDSLNFPWNNQPRMTRGIMFLDILMDDAQSTLEEFMSN